MSNVDEKMVKKKRDPEWRKPNQTSRQRREKRAAKHDFSFNQESTN